MPPSTQPPVPPSTTTTSPPTTKPNLNLDIQILSSILHTIHSTSLIARQPTASASARTTSATTISPLESRLSKLSAALQKRESCGRKLQRLLTCTDREYEEFVALGEEIGEVYEGLLGGACPTPVVQVEQVEAPSPEESVGSSRSGESRDLGLWMKGPKGESNRRENVGEKSGDEQIGEQRNGGSSKSSKRSAKSHSGSTVKASEENPPKMGEGDMSVDEQIQEWMKGRKGRKERWEKLEEKPVQADF